MKKIFTSLGIILCLIFMMIVMQVVIVVIEVVKFLFGILYRIIITIIVEETITRITIATSDCTISINTNFTTFKHYCFENNVVSIMICYSFIKY